MTHPPRHRLSLEAIPGEEAGLSAELGGKENGIGIYIGYEKQQEFDNWEQQPWAVKPENARLETMDVPTTGCIPHDPDELGIHHCQ